MSLIVEDGTGMADAESLCTVTFADTFHSNRGNTLWATMTTTEKEQALRRFTEHARGRYQGRWKGDRVYSTQALDFPRIGLCVDGFAVLSNIVPVEVQNAWALGAFKAASGDLDPDLTQTVKRKKVGPIEVEYADNSSQAKRFKAIDQILGPYLTGMGGANVRLVRA
jgi:hypothetical protein